MSAQAATVTGFGGPSTWQASTTSGGTAAVVDLTGAPGDLGSNVPLGTGAAKLTTNATNPSKAEITTNGNFGTIADFLAGGTLSYSYFKSSVGDLNPFAAASIKLTVTDPTSSASDKSGTFVYEPSWNQATPNASTAVPVDQWLDVLISGISGIFWHNGIYGAANQAGGPGKTLSDWNTFFAGDLASAVITSISIGVGSYNQGQTAYVDDVVFTSGAISKSYDFEKLAAVPGPAALPLLLSGLGALGLLAMRRKRTTAAA